MEHQIFCDGIGRISVIEGMVRLDLYAFSANETDANGNPRPVLSHRIVMGMDGFLRSSEKVVEAVKLIGQARQQQPAPQKPQPAPQAAAPQSKPQPSPQAPPPAMSPAQTQPPPQWPPQAQAAPAPQPAPAPPQAAPSPPVKPPFP